MRFARITLVSLLAVVASQLAPVAAAHAVNGPVATITSPNAGDNLAGIVTVTGTGTIDPGDNTHSLQLFVDGSPVGSAQPCPQTDPNNCMLSFVYDFTDATTASYTLNLKFVTDNTGPGGVMSPGVSINVSSPAPTAGVTSPGNGATVRGSTTIVTSGAVDTSQSNTATSLQLMVDGATVGTAYTCPGSVRTCSHSFTFDFTGGTTGRTLGVRFISTAKPSGTHTTDSPGVSVNVDSPAPASAISSPVAGAQVTGNVSVVANGTVDSTQTDTASTIQLYVNGAAYLTPTACPTSSGVKSCPVTLNWDATGQPAGSYSLKTLFTTATGRSIFSATVGVNLLVPAPTVTISSPVNNGAVSGVTPVNATGTVDSTLTDWPASLMLTVDTVDQTPVSCPGTSHTCSLPLPWDASGLTGPHTLVVTLLTHNGVVAKTNSLTVTASANPPTATVLSPTFGSAASGVVSISAKGTIAASQTDTAVSLQLLVDGQAKGVPTACPSADPKQCPMTFSYDFSGLTGTHQVSVRFVTGTAITVTSPVVGLVVSSPAPAVAVTSPVASATVSGTVSVGLSGTVNASQTDSGVSLQLLVDGAATGSPTTCPAGGDPKACAVSVPWNTTGLSGTHVLQAVFTSAKVTATTSAGVTVTVSNPAPTATIVTPAAGATVSGVVTVTFSGAVNAALTDTAKSAFVALDGVVRGAQVACPASSDLRACATSFSVNTVGLAGAHTLTVTFLTALGQQVVASEKIFVFSTTKTTLNAITPVTAGHAASVKGVVEDIGTGFGLAGQPVQVTFTPAVGKKHTVVVHTDGRGHFATAYKLTANTVVRAVLAGPAYYGVSSASRKATVTAAVSCAKASVRHAAALVGTCKAVGLTKGVKVALQVKVGSHWLALGKATAGAGKVSYAARFAQAGSYTVRVVVVAGKILAAGNGAPFTVSVG